MNHQEKQALALEGIQESFMELAYNLGRERVVPNNDAGWLSFTQWVTSEAVKFDRHFTENADYNNEIDGKTFYDLSEDWTARLIADGLRNGTLTQMDNPPCNSISNP